MYCRFENRLENTALVLSDLQQSLHAYHAADLPALWQTINQAQQQGYWVALALNYELGAHLLGLAHAKTRSTPILSAHIMRHAERTTPWPAPATKPELRAKALIRRQDYLQHLQQIQDGIRRGDYYQVNYSIPLAIESKAAPKDIYQHLAHAHPVAYGTYFSLGSQKILSFSPELFVRKTGDHLLVKPMKGTTARHEDPADDAAAAIALRQSAKDVAENIMIVDLLRNDLGRVSLDHDLYH